MIDRFIVKIIDNMISSDIISGDDKEAYIYAYTIMLEKVLTFNYYRHNRYSVAQACLYYNIPVYIYAS